MKSLGQRCKRCLIIFVDKDPNTGGVLYTLNTIKHRVQVCLGRKVILLLGGGHGGEGVSAAGPALGQLLPLEELGEAAGVLGVARVAHVADLDRVVREVEADNELLPAVLAVRVPGYTP